MLNKAVTFGTEGRGGSYLHKYFSEKTYFSLYHFSGIQSLPKGKFIFINIAGSVDCNLKSVAVYFFVRIAYNSRQISYLRLWL
jgi:hypothetical protein